MQCGTVRVRSTIAMERSVAVAAGGITVREGVAMRRIVMGKAVKVSITVESATITVTIRMRKLVKVWVVGMGNPIGMGWRGVPMIQGVTVRISVRVNRARVGMAGGSISMASTWRSGRDVPRQGQTYDHWRRPAGS